MKVYLWLALVPLALAVLAASALAASGDFSAWSPALRVETTGADPEFNGPSLDGCPFISRDGKTFYMASTRPGGLGGIDIWVSTRDSARDEWGAPVDAGAPVNSPANDFCPTTSRDGHLFYFVCNRPGGCGGDDIYVTRFRTSGSDPPQNLGCDVNSAANEAGPLPTPRAGAAVRCSTSRAPRGRLLGGAAGRDTGDADLYASGRTAAPSSPRSRRRRKQRRGGRPTDTPP